MTDQLANTLVLSGVVLLGFLLWAFSIAFVLRDVNRRSLPAHEQVAWLVLAALLPLIGAIAYLFARLLDRFFSVAKVRQPESKKRITAEKNRETRGKRLPTIAAVDTYRQTVAEMSPNARAELANDSRSNLYLAVQTGPAAGYKYLINAFPVRIGRGPLASLNLDADQGVSRQHAEIYENAGRLRIRDLKSTHGTYLNGKRINDESLNPGDKLTVGLTTLLLLAEQPDGAA